MHPYRLALMPLPLLCTGLYAQDTLLPTLLTPDLGSGQLEIQVESEHEFESDFDDSDESYASTFSSLSTRTTLRQTDSYRIFLDAGIRYRSIDTDQRFGSLGAIPDEVISPTIGVGSKWLLSNGDSIVSGLRLTSSSDEPFNSDEETDFEFELHARFGVGEGMDAIVAGLLYSSQSRLFDGAPVPILAYHYLPNRQLSIVIGLPMLDIRYNPSSTWSAYASVIADNYDLGVHYHISSKHALFVTASNSGWQSWVANRQDDDATLSYEQHRVGLGFESKFNKTNSLKLEAGGSFGRSLVYEEQLPLWEDDPQPDESIDIDGTAYLSASVQLHF